MRFFTPITLAIRTALHRLLIIVGFTILVILYSIKLLLDSLSLPTRKTARLFKGFANKFNQFYENISIKLDFDKSNNVSRSYLIELAFRNMQAKKTRTIVTVGGMAIGIAFIVFLVSLGYGLQDLVTTRVARLEELQQAEVLPGLSEELVLTDEVLSRLNAIPNVKTTLPLISVVGRVSFQDSVSDLAVYGVTTDYLTSSAIQPIQGKIFDSQEIAYTVKNRRTQTDVAVTNEQVDLFTAGEKLIIFNISDGAWLRVRSEASTEGSVIGYTRGIQTNQEGTQVIGSYYTSYSGPEVFDGNGERRGLWIQSKFSLWKEVACAVSQTEQATENVLIDPECEDGRYVPLKDDSGNQVVQTGYTAQISVIVTDKVLGETTQVAQADTTTLETSGTQVRSDGTLPVINLATSSAETVNENRKVVPIPEKSLKQAVVNRAFLAIIGMSEQEAVGKNITLTFVAFGDLVDGEADRIESVPTDYTIVGVTPEEGTPVVYVPFIELRSLGITRISQIKVIADDKDSLPGVRASIEAMGYGTVSVVDTVSQINSLFASFRLVLAVIGMVALSVATLGMFNTLTVSLLERTREVGLMKAMGMKSEEVRELFLTESMIMGFYGGLLGLLIGFGVGKLLSLLLSSVAVARGVGFVDVSVLPFSFVMTVVALSLVVGILTGYYPAKRATKISALNALRYE
jgi:ABC-type antimicrobial peptide transport system permease subunit